MGSRILSVLQIGGFGVALIAGGIWAAQLGYAGLNEKPYGDKKNDLYQEERYKFEQGSILAGGSLAIIAGLTLVRASHREATRPRW